MFQGNDGVISAWNTHDGSLESVLYQNKQKHDVFSHVNDLELLGKDQRLCSAHTNASIVVWDTVHRIPLGELNEHKACVTRVRMNPQHNSLVSGSYDDTLRFWDIVTFKCDFFIQSYCSPSASVILDSFERKE